MVVLRLKFFFFGGGGAKKNEENGGKDVTADGFVVFVSLNPKAHR